jgi:hypothetical protein
MGDATRSKRHENIPNGSEETHTAQDAAEKLALVVRRLFHRVGSVLGLRAAERARLMQEQNRLSRSFPKQEKPGASSPLLSCPALRHLARSHIPAEIHAASGQKGRGPGQPRCGLARQRKLKDDERLFPRHWSVHDRLVCIRGVLRHPTSSPNPSFAAILPFFNDYPRC